MLYQPPVGGAADDPYVTGVPGVTPGSIPPGASIEHPQREIINVIEAAGLTPSDGDLSQLLTAVIPCLGTGVALPTTNIGPIWHHDYNSIMTWQAFTANGAAYTGYASVLVGGLLIDTQPTPRTGYIKSGVANLSRTAYAALRGWAMHNGVMVAEGVWAAGNVAVKDNLDGTTFTAFDVRGEFLRFLDDGRGIDSGRAFGAWQKGTAVPFDIGKNGVVSLTSIELSSGSAQNEVGVDYQSSNTNYASTYCTDVSSASSQVVQNSVSAAWGISRPRNVALLACIKY